MRCLLGPPELRLPLVGSRKLPYWDGSTSNLDADLLQKWEGQSDLEKSPKAIKFRCIGSPSWRHSGSIRLAGLIGNRWAHTTVPWQSFEWIHGCTAVSIELENWSKDVHTTTSPKIFHKMQAKHCFLGTCCFSVSLTHSMMSDCPSPLQCRCCALIGHRSTRKMRFIDGECSPWVIAQLFFHPQQVIKEKIPHLSQRRTREKLQTKILQGQVST